MAEHEAIIEVATGGNTFRISGSEAFVEKMIDQLATAFRIELPAPAHANTGETANPRIGVKGESLDDFIARTKITNDLSAVRKVAAFIWFLTESAGQPTCTIAEIESCFDKTGLRTPDNLNSVINNASKDSHGAYVRSVTRGQYAATTNGKNLVKEMAQG